MAVSVLAFAGPVAAQAPPSAVDQYVEDPSSAGGTTPKGGSGGTRALPPGLATQIEQAGGADAALLTEIVTSSRYGAPDTHLRGKGQSRKSHGGVDRERLAAADPQGDVTAGDSFSAAVSAVQGGDAARLVGLLVALAAITLAAVGAAAVRHRRRSA